MEQNNAPRPQAAIPIVHAAIPINITEYPGPGTHGKQWLCINKMYATEYGWTPKKFLEVTQVGSSGELYHKLEGLMVTDGANVESIFNQVMNFINWDSAQMGQWRL